MNNTLKYAAGVFALASATWSFATSNFWPGLLAVIAAGLTVVSIIRTKVEANTPTEETEWEYTVGVIDRRISYISEDTYGSDLEARQSIWPGSVVLRRRPASEWEVSDGDVSVSD
ncbi:hypothetical protein [Pseudactinotalea sp.]|uniref:hypothetical protein n=1 Tax=Pseudactinotalea sp. TaxID=1926260 RepID=UPI003B3A63F0